VPPVVSNDEDSVVSPSSVTGGGQPVISQLPAPAPPRIATPPPLPPALHPDAAPAPAPPCGLPAGSPLGIGAKLPARCRNPPGQWWKLGSPQLDDDDSDEDADVTLTTSQAVPWSYAEAMHQEDSQEWHQAALEILVPRPTDRPVIGSEWVFAHKYHADGSFDRYKAGLITQGFNKCPGFEYLEVIQW
jgi:hypothetical protein